MYIYYGHSDYYRVNHNGCRFYLIELDKGKSEWQDPKEFNLYFHNLSNKFKEHDSWCMLKIICDE